MNWTEDAFCAKRLEISYSPDYRDERVVSVCQWEYTTLIGVSILSKDRKDNSEGWFFRTVKNCIMITGDQATVDLLLGSKCTFIGSSEIRPLGSRWRAHTVFLPIRETSVGVNRAAFGNLHVAEKKDCDLLI